MLHACHEYRHWTYRLVGHVRENHACSRLLRQLLVTRRLPTVRARSYRPALVPSLRQALVIDLGQPDREEGSLREFRTLWLVETRDDKVFLYGERREANPDRIGGTVMRGIPLLDSTSGWQAQTARVIAARVLGLEADQADLQLLIRVEQALLDNALRAFFGNVNAQILAAVNAEGSPFLEAYNDYCINDPVRRRNRTQAACCFPFFAGMLRTHWQLRQAVDRGAPLAKALALHYQVKPRTIQCSRGLVEEQARSEQKPELLKRLDQLSAEYLPQSDADWLAFLDLSEPLADLARVLNRDFHRFAAPFAKGWHQGREYLAAKLGTEFDVSAIYELMRATYRYGVYPLLQAELSELGGSEAVAENPPAAFFPLWFGRCSLTRLTDLAARWRSLYRGFSLERLKLNDPESANKLTWLPLLDRASGYRHGACRVIELTSRQALELQGREQQHCVASYAVKCLLGESAIFSIQDRRTGKAASTFEVGLADDMPILLQHRGEANAEPGPEQGSIAQRFVERVLKPLPLERIAAVRKARATSGRGVCRFLERPGTAEDPLTTEEQTALRDLVAFAHPKSVARSGVLGFIQANGPFDSFICQACAVASG